MKSRNAERKMVAAYGATFPAVMERWEIFDVADNFLGYLIATGALIYLRTL